MTEKPAIFQRHQSWLTPTGLAAGILLITAFSAAPEAPEANVVELRGQPVDGGVYFIGNSMFGTGLDLAAARRSLPEETVSFGYYDGHYSSMWYAGFRNSLLPSGIRPKVVIWGFRPTYALYPAFRQNRETELSHFYDTDDPVFQKLLALSSGETTLANTGRSFDFVAALSKYAPVVSRRAEIKDAIAAVLARTVARLFAGHVETAQSFAEPDGTMKISDVIVSFATGGEIQRADALVIDNGERFVTGPAASFDQSFVPLTAKLLKDANIAQLVVIFKPVSIFAGEAPPDVLAYYHDAVAFLEKENIPYIDFLADEALTPDLYAKGDHYTHDGMRYVTDRMVAALVENGLVEQGPAE